MHVLATGTGASIAQAIAAVGSVVSALVLLFLGLRSQSAEAQREHIKQDVAQELHKQLDPEIRGIIIGELVRNVVRQELGRPGGRRRYDPPPED